MKLSAVQQSILRRLAKGRRIVVSVTGRRTTVGSWPPGLRRQTMDALVSQGLVRQIFPNEHEDGVTRLRYAITEAGERALEGGKDG